MPLIRRRREPLSLKHMSQMPSTFRTRNLSPLHPKRAVRVPSYSTWNRIEVGWPAAAGFEFVGRAVKGRLAGGAGL